MRLLGLNAHSFDPVIDILYSAIIIDQIPHTRESLHKLCEDNTIIRLKASFL